MTTYYLDPTATGANDGTSTTDAWETFQDSIDGTNGTAPSAGDIVLCRHTQDSDEDITNYIDFITTGIAGSSSGHIKWIGVNSDWINDGTRYIITLGSATAGDIWKFTSVNDYLWFENFELVKDYGGVGSGITLSGALIEYHVYINIYVHDFSNYGYYSNAILSRAKFFKCRFSSNGVGGVYKISGGNHMAMCRFDNNSGNGVEADIAGPHLYGCLADNNSDNGFKYACYNNVTNCIGYNNGNVDFLGTGVSNKSCILISCRAYSTGVDYNFDNSLNGTMAEHFIAYSYGQSGVLSEFGDGLVNLSYIGSDTNVVGIDENGGFVDPSSDNFNLTDDATLRSLAVEVP